MSILNISLEKSFVFENLTWRVKFPTPNVDRMIDVEVSKRLGGVPIDSIPSDTRQYTKACVTLNSVVIQAPEEYREIRDFESVMDQEFVIGLFNEYFRQLSLFQEELQEKKKIQIDSVIRKFWICIWHIDSKFFRWK